MDEDNEIHPPKEQETNQVPQSALHHLPFTMPPRFTSYYGLLFDCSVGAFSVRFRPAFDFLTAMKCALALVFPSSMLSYFSIPYSYFFSLLLFLHP
jgi:hypothetical protein